MEAFYDHPSNKGSHFDWPRGEIIELCPATGRKVKTNNSTVHLLVATSMTGISTRGNKLLQLTRIMPRILTLEGYEQIMGGEGLHRQVKSERVRRTRLGDGFETEPVTETVARDFYPEVAREICGRSVLSATEAWEKWSRVGKFNAFDRLLKDKSSQAGMTVLG